MKLNITENWACREIRFDFPESERDKVSDLYCKYKDKLRIRSFGPVENFSRREIVLYCDSSCADDFLNELRETLK